MKNEAMEHPMIDDEKVVDRYLARQLSPEEEALFEEHLFECADCLEQVRWGEEMRRGLRAMAAEDAGRAVSLGFLAWLRSRGPGQLAGLMALALAFVLLPAVVVWQRAELNRLRAPQAAAVWAEPVGDFLVVSMGLVRDTGAVEIRPDPEKKAILLSLELPAVDAARYRVTLRDGTGSVLWRGEDLEPNLYDSLLVALPASFLSPGSYRITVESLPAAPGKDASEMEFRVLPAN